MVVRMVVRFVMRDESDSFLEMMIKRRVEKRKNGTKENLPEG